MLPRKFVCCAYHNEVKKIKFTLYSLPSGFFIPKVKWDRILFLAFIFNSSWTSRARHVFQSLTDFMIIIHFVDILRKIITFIFNI